MKITPIHCPINSKINSKRNSSSLQTKSYNPSFSSIPIYDLTALKQEKYGRKTKMPVRFSRITPEDNDDYYAIVQIGNNLVQGDTYGRIICCNFRYFPPKEINFFAIETEEDIPLKDKILSMAQVNIYQDLENKHFTSSKSRMQISLLQSFHNIPYSRFEDIKGGGELCLYGLVKLAQEKNIDYITLSSSRNAFYDHIQFGKKSTFANSTMYKLEKDDYEEFLKRVEAKYGFNSCNT